MDFGQVEEYGGEDRAELAVAEIGKFTKFPHYVDGSLKSVHISLLVEKSCYCGPVMSGFMQYLVISALGVESLEVEGDIDQCHNYRNFRLYTVYVKL